MWFCELTMTTLFLSKKKKTRHFFNWQKHPSWTFPRKSEELTPQLASLIHSPTHFHFMHRLILLPPPIKTSLPTCTRAHDTRTYLVYALLVLLLLHDNRWLSHRSAIIHDDRWLSHRSGSSELKYFINLKLTKNSKGSLTDL